MAEPLPLEAIQEGLQVYLRGETGVQFDALAHFAEPLFRLYEVDLRAAWEKPSSVRQAEELATLLAVLETSRLLWAYFDLNEGDRLRYRPALEEHLLGPGAGAEEQTAFQTLLNVVEKHWRRMGAAARAAARVPGFALPPFETLLNLYASAGEAAPGDTRYGPENLDLPEALALFTRPMLDDRHLLEDPDTLERTLARAYAYWELAHAPPGEHEARLALIQKAHAETPEEQRHIEAEAERMVARFFSLFPEQRARRGG